MSQFPVTKKAPLLRARPLVFADGCLTLVTVSAPAAMSTTAVSAPATVAAGATTGLAAGTVAVTAVEAGPPAR